MYRKLTVEKARRVGPIEVEVRGVEVNFLNFPMTIRLDDEYLKEKGMSLESFKPGTEVEIKGKKGNEDADFWGFDVVEDIRIPG